MRKYLIYAGILLAAVVACEKEQVEKEQLENEPIHVSPITLTASGEMTKATLSATDDIIWEEGDIIGVRMYKGTTVVGTDAVSGYYAKDVEFVLDEGDGGKASGTFSYQGTDKGDGYLHWGYAAFYPKYDSNVGGDGKVYIHLQSYYDQYVSGRILMPMVANLAATNEDRPSNIKFYHVAAGIKVTLKDVPTEAMQASLCIPNHNIQGWYNVDPSKAGDDTNGILTPNESTYSADRNTVYLKFAQGSEKRDMTFIFPIPTMTLVEGDQLIIKLWYKDSNNNVVDFWTKSSTISASTAASLPSLTRGSVLVLPDATVPVTPEEAAAPIWIDGKIKDWTNASNVTTFSTSSDRIVEWKYTFDDNNIYFLYKINAGKIKFDDQEGNYDWKSYVYIGFDTDVTKGAEGQNGGTGSGMDALAVIFPWRGTTKGDPQCVIGEDRNSHIEKPVGTRIKVGTEDKHLKVGGKIDGEFCYVEVRVPFEDIGITSSKDYITVNHAMDYYPTGAQMIAIAGPLPGIINASDQTVGVGQTVAIGATTNSTATITYESSNPSIATVDDSGVITGVAQGTTTITLNVAAVSGKYSSATKNITVTVTAPFTPAIDIDGVISDWTTNIKNGVVIESFDNDGEVNGSAYNRIPRWKATSDERYIYFLIEIGSGKIISNEKIYTGIDIYADDAGSVSAGGNIGTCDVELITYPFVADSNPVTCNSGLTGSINYNGNNVGQVTVNGMISGNAFIEMSIPRALIGSPDSNVSLKVEHSYNQGWVTGWHSFNLK